MKTIRIAICASIMLVLAITGSKALAQTKAKSHEGQAAALVARIDKAAVEEFQKAWRVSRAGVGEIEGLVLLYRNSDGSIAARSQGHTNQHKQFTVTLSSNVIAIVHTHPNSCNPKPEGSDLAIADRLGIPVLTITNRGMYMYDPSTKKITKLQNGLDWLDPDRWFRKADFALAR